MNIVSQVYKHHCRRDGQNLFSSLRRSVDCRQINPNHVLFSFSSGDGISRMYTSSYKRNLNQVLSNAQGKRHSYVQGINSILSSSKFQRIQSSLILQGLWSKSMFSFFRNWLLSNSSSCCDTLDWEQLRKEWLKQPKCGDGNHSSFDRLLRIQKNNFETQIIDVWSTRNEFRFPTSFFSLAKMVFHELVIQYKTQLCVALFIWNKVKESGIVLNQSTSELLLNVIYHGSHFDDEYDQLIQLAIYHDSMNGATDITANLRAIELLKQGKASIAEEVLDSLDYAQRNDTLMSKPYVLILKSYCESKNVLHAVSLFRRMRRRRLLNQSLSLNLHLLVLMTLAETGHLRTDTEYIRIFGEILYSILTKVNSIEEDFARKLYNILAVGYRPQSSHHKEADELITHLSELESTEQIPLLSHPAKYYNEVISGCVIFDDMTTRLCPVTNVKLKLTHVELKHTSFDRAKQKELYSDVLDLSEKLYARSPEFKPSDGVERASNELKKFTKRLQSNKHAYTAIVDGANVGFNVMSYSTRKTFSYRQIQAVVKSLESDGERPLVILPHKYSKPGFLIASRYRQNLNKDEMKILQDLKNKGNIFFVPPRCEDDLYCITALLLIQCEAQHSNNQLAKRPYLITNDRLYDHSSNLKQKAFFRKLYQCHAVRYRLNASPDDEDCIEVQYMPAEFLHQIQVNVCPKPRNQCKELDMKWAGRVWHFPVKGWPANKRFLIGYPENDC